MIRNLSELYQYRALLVALSMRELKARYRASVLGFLWTFLNPTLSMFVYWLVFEVVMVRSGGGMKAFPFFIFSGLLPWIFFSSSVMAGTTSVSDRRDLLTKVRFPAQVLPATVVLTNFINMMLSVPLLVGLGLVFGIVPSWHLVLILPVLIVQVFFTLAVTYLLAALNVAFRDLQHIVASVVQLAFFLTPVLWELKILPALFGLSQPDSIALVSAINPMAPIVEAWHAIFYNQQPPTDWPALGIVAVEALVIMLFSTWVFERRREEFAELV
ncbi:MAG: ABC transporter permease [Myxococcaceae bacterium]